MSAKDALIAQYNALAAGAAKAYADAKRIIAMGTGPGPLYGGGR